jgi:hypothetical protein
MMHITARKHNASKMRIKLISATAVKVALSQLVDISVLVLLSLRVSVHATCQRRR